MSTKAADLRQRILDLTAEYFSEAFPESSFVAVVSTVPASDKIVDASDMQAVVGSALDS
jgi:CDP-6-deoxy-D-xylo-4-hexulose-3-dehydrase